MYYDLGTGGVSKSTTEAVNHLHIDLVLLVPLKID